MEEILAVTKHSINSDLDKPLNELINELCTQLSQEEKTLINSIISKLDNSTYGLSALKTILDTIKTNSSCVGAIYSAGSEVTVATLVSSSTSVSASKTTIGSFVAKLSGVVTLTVDIQNTQSSQVTYRLYVGHYVESAAYYNSSTAIALSAYFESETTGTVAYKATTSKSITMSVVAGKRYYIAFEGEALLYLTSVKITASISKVSD